MKILIKMMYMFCIIVGCVYQMQADFDRSDYDILNISNLTLYSDTDTIFVYPQRQYNCNRKYYFSGFPDKNNNIINYGIFDQFSKIVVSMGTNIIRGGYFNEFAIIDSIAKKNRYIILDSIVIELNDDNYFESSYTKRNFIESDSLCSKIANSVFDSSFHCFAIYDDERYICVTKVSNDSLSYIFYNQAIIDSVCNYFNINKNKTKSFMYPINGDYFIIDKDTLYYISINNKHFNYNSGYLNYLDIHSINNGKTKLISDSSSIANYFYNLKLPISNWPGNIHNGSFKIISKIDNTIILYYLPSGHYFFYDYINKKFFDPVIKIIND